MSTVNETLKFWSVPKAKIEETFKMQFFTYFYLRKNTYFTTT